MKTRWETVIQQVFQKKILFLLCLIISILSASYFTNFTSFYWRFILFIFIIGAIAILILDEKNIEKTCFFIIIIFGTFFVFLSPVFDVWDEPAHYGRAEYISEGNLILRDGDNELAISKDYEYLTDLMEYNGINRFRPQKNFFHTNLFSKGHNKKRKVETKIKATRNYISFAYLPSALGLWLGKIISSGNLGVMFYLGRFFNLLFYAIMAYFAIKKSGNWKLMVGFFSIQHLPIYVSASFSQDSFFYGLSLLILASFIRIFDDKEKINYKDVIVVTILCILMAFSKLPNVALVGLLLFISPKRYESRKVYLSVLIGITVVLLASLLWIKQYSSITVTDSPSLVNESHQIQFIVNNSKSFLSSLILGFTNTILSYKQYFAFGWSFFDSSIAQFFSLILFSLVVFIYPRKLKIKINKLFKFAIFSVSCAIIILTNIIMYLSFTGVGEKVINGVQGRYFYGILVFLPFLVNFSNLVFNDNLNEGTYFNDNKYIFLILGSSILILVWMAGLRVGAYY